MTPFYADLWQLTSGGCAHTFANFACMGTEELEIRLPVSILVDNTVSEAPAPNPKAVACVLEMSLVHMDAHAGCNDGL